jgi:hypothetical protein
MTLGVTTAQRNQTPARSAFADRKLTRATTGTFGVSPSFEVTRTLDPSDGANVSGGSSYIDGMPLLPSSAGLAGVLGASDEGILQKIKTSNAYLKRIAGKPYPAPHTPYPWTEFLSYGTKSSLYEGWNAAAQPGDPPGLAGCGCQKLPAPSGVSGGFKEINVGPMSWEEALLYSPAPLTDNLGALRGLDEIYRESQSDLRPGFAGVGSETLLPLAAIGGFVWWLFSR